MQNIIMYVSAAEMVGEVKDFAGAQPATPPTFMIGVEALLKMRLFAEGEGDRAYPIEELNQLSGWRFVMDSDFDSATPVKLEADNANIQLATVTDEAGGSSRSYTEVAIPMPNMNTIELAEYLAAQEQVTLTGELTGYDANGAVVFCVQVKNFTVRNRITASGTPTNVEDEYLTAAQTRAIVASAQLPDKWPVPVEPLKYTDTIGYYAELLNPGDTVKSVYNVFDCGMAGVRIFSANPEISGNITVKINHQNFTFFINGEAQWVEMVLNQAVDGVLTVELVKGLSDTDGSPVSILITAVTVSGAMNISSTAGTAKQIAAKPLLYSDTLGYYHLLDDNYLIEPCYRAENLTAVILKVRSANPEISGNAAIKITVGETVKSAVIPIGTEDTAAVVTLDTPASGVIKIERDTASSDDTLKDGGATVSVIIRDIQYNYVEE